MGNIWSKDNLIAIVALAGILLHLLLRFAVGLPAHQQHIPLLLVLVFGGLPLVYELVVKALRKEFGSDLLAGLSIVTSLLLEEYLAGAFVVLMLSGGQALEHYAIESASSVLHALVKRRPHVAHRKQHGQLIDAALATLHVGDLLVVFPHEICPVDGVVVEGHGAMDEAYLTGEPYTISKTPGSIVLSGALNGEHALTIRATKLPQDSRYAKIIAVMRQAEVDRPRMRRLGDRLGAFYTPVAVAVALLAWAISGSAVRFLAVLVVATPCPLLIAIPVAIIGSISLAAKRGIIIRDPKVLEQIDTCRTIILDKTGTLTYGIPQLVAQLVEEGCAPTDVLRLVASLEQYSKHPLAQVIVAAAIQAKQPLREAVTMSEPPGQGLRGTVAGREILITNRKSLLTQIAMDPARFPPVDSGLECVIAIDGVYAATYRFCDSPRPESKLFVDHLSRRHHFHTILLVSGDRESEVRYLADQVGIKEVYASKSPEEKVAIVRNETARAKTLFVGDGINDAPALMAATVGVAFGQGSDITTEAAGAVILESSLEKVDEFLHISHRLRTIALQSALGGMALSVIGMLVASLGYLPPVAGALTQEVIDVLVILNALRAAIPPESLIDF